jgi:alkaline phosphatase D
MRPVGSRVFSIATLLFVAACDAEPPAPGADAGFDAGRDAGMDAGMDAGPVPDRVVGACDEVVVAGAAASAGAFVAGWPLVWAEARGADLVFRAPAVARPTFLEVAGRIVRVDPRAPSGFDVPGLAADCGTFAHGVASGDPRADGVTLWTRATPPAAGTTLTLSWRVSREPSLAAPVAEGVVDVVAADDWTAHVDVSGLAPGTTYYFAFADPDGDRSVLGRTRTAAADDAVHARFAVASCSSLFSGWFNAYRRIAERDDLDLVIHLGDYIYDFVDENERIRVPPSGTVEDLTDAASHRRRHALYLSDPDLRAARAAHPWLLLWDNHDLARALPEYGGGVQAFREWNPIRPLPAGVAPDVLYRSLRYGRLADVFVLDVYLFQGREMLPGSSAPAVLGAAQEAWFESAVGASDAAWRVIGAQKVLVEFGDLSGWLDYPDARSRFLGFFARAGIADNLFLSGDSHITVFQDGVDVDPASPYDPATGAGSVGGEFLPTSISRGNFDETLGPRSERVIGLARSGFLRSNPWQVDLELTSHGYGLVDITPERIVGETWYSPILAPADAETFGLAYAMRRGANRWERVLRTEPTE